MSVLMTGRYLGNKKTELTHGPSGTKIITAAPIDNNGDGSSFSPTDLCAISVGACMMTVMGIVAERHDISLQGMHMSVEKEMQESPRKIKRVSVELHLPSRLTSDNRSLMERTAHTCPVHRTLAGQTEIEVEFFYDVATGDA